MRSPEHPCPNHNNVRVPRAYDHQSIHALSLCFKPQVLLGKCHFYLFLLLPKVSLFLLSKCASRCSETLKIAEQVPPSQCLKPSPKKASKMDICKNPTFLQISTSRITLPSEKTQGPRVDVPPFWWGLGV